MCLTSFGYRYRPKLSLPDSPEFTQCLAFNLVNCGRRHPASVGDFLQGLGSAFLREGATACNNGVVQHQLFPTQFLTE